MRYVMKHGRMDLLMDPGQEGSTVEQLLKSLCVSEKNQKKMLAAGELELNHAELKHLGTALKTHDVLTVHIPDGLLDFKPAAQECPIVYEDDFVYVAHKERGMIVHGEPDETDTLACQAAAWQQAHGILQPIRYIHRLDKDTCGLVLFVKVPFLQAWYDEQLRLKLIQRHYLAITTGKAALHQQFTFRMPIGRDRHVSGKYRVSETGREALTEAECIQKKGSYLLMSCRLETGRTHQIRVHLSASGHPIVNDPLYGNPSADFTGMGLWADEICFMNPITGEACRARDLPCRDFDYFGTELRG